MLHEILFRITTNGNYSFLISSIAFVIQKININIVSNINKIGFISLQ